MLHTTEYLYDDLLSFYFSLYYYFVDGFNPHNHSNNTLLSYYYLEIYYYYSICLTVHDALRGVPSTDANTYVFLQK